MSHHKARSIIFAISIIALLFIFFGVPHAKANTRVTEYPACFSERKINKGVAMYSQPLRENPPLVGYVGAYVAFYGYCEKTMNGFCLETNALGYFTGRFFKPTEAKEVPYRNCD